MSLMKLLGRLGMSTTLIVAAFLAMSVVPAHAQQHKITMAVSWFAYQTKHMPYWLAKEKGWFKDEGLTDVEIKQNRGSEASIQALMSGQVQFAEVSPVTLLRMIARGDGKVNVRIIGVVEQKMTDGLGFLASSGIKTPKDFEGRKLGMVAQSLNNTLWPPFAKVTGINIDKVERVNVDWTNFRQLLLAHRTEITNWIAGQPEDADAVLKGEEPVVGFTFGDYLPLIGSSWATTTDMIAKDPKTVRAFSHAIQKALKYEIEQPREAVTEAAKIQSKYLEMIPSEAGRIKAALEIVPGVLVKDDTKGKPYGWSNPESWQQMIDLMAVADNWPRKPTVAESMTNAFLE